MGTYTGNVGHLMQHWTLCEVLSVAKEHTPGLSFIDAHAMAPWATECPRPDIRFRSVKKLLPGKGSVYEQAWGSLSQRQQVDGYPNSAAFVRKIWKCQYSLLLCELCPTTAKEIDNWLQPQEGKLFRGDWRNRFEEGLPTPCEVRLPTNALTLVSFDPNMYSRHTPKRPDPARLYRTDLKLALRALDSVKGGILMQLSTYTANGNNPQGAVISSVNSVLRSGGFALAAVVRVDGNMMSVIFSRNVKWAADLAGLPHQFEKWLIR